MISQLIEHLWQSTLFAGAAFLLTLALRKNRAHVRYWVWFAASLKFLTPFSVLVAVGSQVPWQRASTAAPTEWVAVVDQISQPLMFPVIATQAVAARAEGADYFLVAIFGLWACGVAAVSFHWLVRWRRMSSVRRSAIPFKTLRTGKTEIQVMSSRMLHEPGVFGILRPVLLLPDGISERIEREQLDAILAHELSHVRRRDNLTAAIHMAVEALFWFHPLVWWVGSRLIEERERACDEAVLQAGGDSGVYAEAILIVCKLYAEAPLACMSGVGGSHLRRRIEEIMKNRVAHRMHAAKRMALALAGVAAVAAPVAVGIASARPVSAQADSTLRFEVATVKPGPNQPGPIGGSCRGIDTPVREGGGPLAAMAKMNVAPVPLGRCAFPRVTLKFLMTTAYGVGSLDGEKIVGGPGWMDSEAFTIEAKAEDAATTTGAQLLVMLQNLLADRFKLRFHREAREVDGYELVVYSGGPKLQRGSGNEQGRIGRMAGQPLTARNATIDALAKALSASLGRPVVNKTGLDGGYDFTLAWTPGEEETGGPFLAMLPPDVRARIPQADPNGPSIFTAVQEQLGLRLERAKATVDVLVIDSVARPAEN